MHVSHLNNEIDYNTKTLSIIHKFECKTLM